MVDDGTSPETITGVINTTTGKEYRVTPKLKKQIAKRNKRIQGEMARESGIQVDISTSAVEGGSEGVPAQLHEEEPPESGWLVRQKGTATKVQEDIEGALQQANEDSVVVKTGKGVAPGAEASPTVATQMEQGIFKQRTGAVNPEVSKKLGESLVVQKIREADAKSQPETAPKQPKQPTPPSDPTSKT